MSTRPVPEAGLGEAEILRLYDDPARVAAPDRPYVIVNMVMSVDGSTALGGVTEGLGSRTDRAIFLHLHDTADAILVGAATLRAEHYGPARPTASAHALRQARGQLPRPPIVVVTRSLVLDWDAAFFAEADPPPILLTPDQVDPIRRQRAARAARVIAGGSGSVDLPAAMIRLRAAGIGLLLCEGGPTLNAELWAAGLVDEVCLTLAPMLAGGDGPRGIFGPGAASVAVTLTLAHAVTSEGYLYLRYRRPSGGQD